MRKLRTASLISLMLVSGFISAFAQDDWSITDLDSVYSRLREEQLSENEQLVAYGYIASKIGKAPVDSVEKYSQLHLELALQLRNRKEEAVAYGNLGGIHERRGEYQASLEYRLKMMEIADELEDEELSYLAYSELGNYFLDRKDYQKAIRYASVSKSLSDRIKDKNSVTSRYNLGIAYGYAGKTDSAEVVFREGLEMATEMGDINGLGLHYSGLAMTSYYRGELDLGLSYADKAISYFEEAKNYGQMLGATVSKSIYNYQLGRVEEAISNSERALGLARKISSASQELTILSNMSLMYEQLGEFEKAYRYLDSFVVIRDSLFNIEKEEAIAEVETKYEVERKQRDLNNLKKQKELDQLQIRTQSRFNITLGIISVISILMLLLLWRNNVLRKKANQMLLLEKKLEDQKRVELEFSNQKLQFENSKAQFEILKNQVDPHFMFNALNTLMELVESFPDRALPFIRSLSTLFRNMLELRSEHMIRLEDELRHTKAYLHLQQVRFGDKLQVEVNVREKALKRFLPPFSLQQVVENAIKHNRMLQKEPLIIHISSESEAIVVRNKISARLDKAHSTGTGIKNIKERYQLLGIDAPSFEKVGDEFVVRLPIKI